MLAPTSPVATTGTSLARTARRRLITQHMDIQPFDPTFAAQQVRWVSSTAPNTLVEHVAFSRVSARCLQLPCRMVFRYLSAGTGHPVYATLYHVGQRSTSTSTANDNDDASVVAASSSSSSSVASAVGTQWKYWHVIDDHPAYPERFRGCAFETLSASAQMIRDKSQNGFMQWFVGLQADSGVRTALLFNSVRWWRIYGAPAAFPVSEFDYTRGRTTVPDDAYSSQSVEHVPGLVLDFQYREDRDTDRSDDVAVSEAAAAVYPTNTADTDTDTTWGVNASSQAAFALLATVATAVRRWNWPATRILCCVSGSPGASPDWQFVRSDQVWHSSAPWNVAGASRCLRVKHVVSVMRCFTAVAEDATVAPVLSSYYVPIAVWLWYTSLVLQQPMYAFCSTLHTAAPDANATLGTKVVKPFAESSVLDTGSMQSWCKQWKQCSCAGQPCCLHPGVILFGGVTVRANGTLELQVQDSKPKLAAATATASLSSLHEQLAAHCKDWEAVVRHVDDHALRLQVLWNHVACNCSLCGKINDGLNRSNT